MKRTLLPLLAALALSACGNSAPTASAGLRRGRIRARRRALRRHARHARRRARQGVEAGTPLFALEAENEDAARREAEERVRSVAAQVEDLKKGKRVPPRSTRCARSSRRPRSMAAYSEKEWRRQLDLVSKGFVSQSRADEARAARDRDHNKVVELQNDLGTMPGARPDEIRAAEAEAGGARSARAGRVEAQAEIGGRDGGRNGHRYAFRARRVGSRGRAGGLAAAAGEREGALLRSRAALGAVRLGQKVTLACDGCAGPIDAGIAFIAPQAEFTPPVIYSKDNRAKLVFLVEARPAAEDAVKLHPGQPVDVTLP